MLVHDRQARILDYLQKHPSSSVLHLQRSLGVSRSTVRRDLVELEEQGEIIRVHGGVVHRDTLRGEPTYDRRGREGVASKRAIAAIAASLVPNDCVVYIDAGTTCVEVARQLAARSDLKILTHSVRLLIEMGDSAAGVTCIGGEYRAVSQALVGGLALSWLKQLHCDLAILGASGLDETGVSTTELSEAALKQGIAERAAEVMLVADHRKWERPAAVTFAPWASIQTFITDSLPKRTLRRSLSAHGTETVIAGEKRTPSSAD